MSTPATTPRAVAKKAPARNQGLVAGAAARRAAVENLSMLLGAGVDASSALQATALGVGKRGQLLARLKSADNHVRAGGPLWEALSLHGLMSPHQAWLVRVGEESGTLAKHIDTVIQQERREETFRRQLTSALLYPGIVISIALIVGIGVSWLILPRLVNVFRSLRIELPFLTRVLLNMGVFLQHHGYWAVPLALALLALCAYVLFFAPRTKSIGQRMLLRTPGFGKLIRDVELSRLGTIIGSLLNAGVPVPQTLEAVADSASFYPYPQLYRHIFNQVNAGRTIAEALAAWKDSQKLIPATVQQVLATAEQSGQLAVAASQIGSSYERRLETSTKDLIAVIEPAMLFIVWIGVVGLAASIITPLYSVLSGINR